jgi:hypothetical protein
VAGKNLFGEVTGFDLMWQFIFICLFAIPVSHLFYPLFSLSHTTRANHFRYHQKIFQRPVWQVKIWLREVTGFD